MDATPHEVFLEFFQDDFVAAWISLRHILTQVSENRSLWLRDSLIDWNHYQTLKNQVNNEIKIVFYWDQPFLVGLVG